MTDDEAKRIFQVRDATGMFRGMLLDELGDRFAGMWIEHEPELRVFVAALPADAARVAALLKTQPFCDMAEIVETQSSLADLDKLAAKVSEASPVPVETRIGVVKKAYKVTVLVAGEENRRLLDKALADAGLASRPDLIVETVPSLDQPPPGSPPGTPPGSPPGFLPLPPRYAGSDRYSTAAAISKAPFSAGVDVVYVATGVNFPDALAGAAASGGHGPILLVTKDTIPAAVAAELKRLKPKRIVVLGGEGVVSQTVQSALKEYTSGKTARQAGSDRYSTAAAVSGEHFKPGLAVVFVATGEDFPDALTGGPAAAKRDGPILLTAKDKLPAATVAELRRLKPKRIVVLGGEGVVSQTAQSALKRFTSGDVTRLAGPDRYATGAAISKDAYKPGVPVAYIATGEDFPDALAGGAAGALKDGPVLLVAKDSIPEATVAELKRLKPKQIIVLGGTAAVSEKVRNALADYAS